MNPFFRYSALGLFITGTSALFLAGCGSSAPKDAANPPAVEQPARDAAGRLSTTGTETLDVVATPVVESLPPVRTTPVGMGPAPTPVVPPSDIPTTPPLAQAPASIVTPESAGAAAQASPTSEEKRAAVIARAGAEEIRSKIKDLDLINEAKMPSDKAAVILEDAKELRARIEADNSQQEAPKSVVLDSLDEFTYYVEQAAQATNAQQYSGLMRKAQISLEGMEAAAKR